MKETILLFHVPDKEKLLKIEMALFPLHVRLKHVKEEEYHQPLGVLAGIKRRGTRRRKLCRNRPTRYHDRFRIL